MARKSAAPEKKLRTGATLEVLTPENRLIFLGKTEKFDGQTLQIGDSTGGDVPPVLFGTEVKLRGFRSGAQPFELRGRVCGSTDRFWRVDALQNLAMHGRVYYRQTISLEVLILRVRSDGTSYWPRRDTAAAGRLLDISCGGLGLRSREQYAGGERLLLEKVPLQKDAAPFTLLCRVCNFRWEGSYIRYGCRLEGMSAKEQDRLQSVILQLQRSTIQSRRGE